MAFVQQRAPHQEGQQGEAPAGEQSAPGAEGPSSSSASPAAHAPLAAAEAEPSDVGSELSEHALLLQQQQRHCRGASPSADGPGAGPAPGAPSQEAGGEEREAEEEGAANLVLATGWSRALCVWEEGEERRAAKYRRLAGHAADVLCMAPLGAEVAATGAWVGWWGGGTGRMGRRQEEREAGWSSVGWGHPPPLVKACSVAAATCPP